MGFQILNANITTLKVDAIVNPTDQDYSGRGGVDRQIHNICGPDLQNATDKLPKLHLGEAKVTNSFGLPCKYIIHTSGPHWTGKSFLEVDLLGSCYRNSLVLANSLGCKTIAFPLISSQGKHFPKELALTVAVNAIEECVQEFPQINIILAVWGKWTQKLPPKLFEDVSSYVSSSYVPDDNYAKFFALDFDRVQHKNFQNRKLQDIRELECNGISTFERQKEKALEETESFEKTGNFENAVSLEEAVNFEKAESLADEDLENRVLENSSPEPSYIDENLIKALLDKPTQANLDKVPVDETFAAMLARLLKQQNLQHSAVQDEIGMSGVGFWKILKGEVSPKKMTVFGIAIALKLSLKETEEMLMKAGFAINQSSLQDIIISGLIQNKIYDRNVIDDLLYSLDLQPLPGA